MSLPIPIYGKKSRGICFWIRQRDIFVVPIKVISTLQNAIPLPPIIIMGISTLRLWRRCLIMAVPVRTNLAVTCWTGARCRHWICFAKRWPVVIVCMVLASRLLIIGKETVLKPDMFICAGLCLTKAGILEQLVLVMRIRLPTVRVCVSAVSVPVKWAGVIWLVMYPNAL